MAAKKIAADTKQPMFRVMVAIHVDFTNFGQPQRAAAHLPGRA